MDLNHLLTCHEGKTLEFKRDASSPRGIVRTVVAFANSAGGTVLIGVADRTREIVGVDDPLDLEERLANIIADSVEPLIAPEIDVVTWRDKSLLAVRVHPGASRPYRVAGEGDAQGVYVRVGSTNRRADAAMAAQIGRSVSGPTYDEVALATLGDDALDVAAVQAVFDGRRHIDRRALKTLRLLTEREGQLCPTVGGVLLFGVDREATFPDAVIEVARFAGFSRSTFTDAAIYGGCLPVALEHTMAFVRRNIAQRYEIEGLARTESWQYPLVAVREVIVNAVVHADYSLPGLRIRVAIHDDRIEVDSPGLLLPGLTVEDVLGGVSRVRNRVIARVFRELGIIEQWGTGIPRAIEACRAAGLADPRIEEMAQQIRVTLYADVGEGGRVSVKAADARVLQELAGAGPLSTSEVARRIERTPRSARERLKSLVEAGLVVEVGSSPNDPNRKYYIAEDAAPYRTS
ncbi:MAG: putative DNA binding domain-containing protein [Coriobacteriia bacterium]|nr:putative DNA binding domain-containing protein [Coriobacteriia bacterium]